MRAGVIYGVVVRCEAKWRRRFALRSQVAASLCVANQVAESFAWRSHVAESIDLAEPSGGVYRRGGAKWRRRLAFRSQEATCIDGRSQVAASLSVAEPSGGDY